ncbi:MAG: glycosyltransferase family 39 protein [Alphaproteobacteria bacterium]
MNASPPESSALAPVGPQAGWRFQGGWAYLLYVALVAAQCALAVDARALWFSDEARYGAALVEMIGSGDWLTLTLNGLPYPDKPPVYFWLLAGIARLGGGMGSWVFFIGAALSGFAYVCAGHFLVRRVVPARPELALATGLLLLGTPYVATLFHYSRMDPLFAAAIVAAMACLHSGLRRPSFSGWIVAGFALATLASFIKGPLGHGLPLLALLVDAATTRRLRRILAADMAVGVLLSLAVAVAWFAAVVATKGWDFVDRVLDDQILQRAVSAWHHKHPVWFYLPLMIGMWLPWTALPALRPVRAALAAGARAAWRRALDAPPTVYFGIVWAAGFVFLSLLSGKIHIYLLPTLAPLAAATAAALIGMAPAARAFAWRSAAVVYAVAGVAALVEGIAGFAPFPIGGLVPLGIVMLAGATALAWFDGSVSAFRPLWINLGLVTIVMNILGLLIAPSLDAVLSPREQARLMRDYADRGYAVVAFATYDGVYTYDYGGIVDEIDDPAELAQRMAANDRLVVVMRESSYRNLGDQVAGLAIVQQQRIAENVYLMLVQDRATPAPAR